MDSVPQSDQRVTYSNTILFEKSPIEAMEALKIRRNQIKIINKELAEWFTAYGRQRLHYVEELKRLHQQGLQLFSDNNKMLENDKLNALGLCQPLWSDTLKLMYDEITLFDQSTRKMGRDMIAPLKLFTRNNDTRLVEMDEIAEVAANIKLCESENQDPTQFVEEWSRRAPDFFATFESYDFERLILLKDIFSKYQSDISDVIDTFKRDNETGLEHVLNLNVDEEIHGFSQNVIKTNLPIDNIVIPSINNKNNSRTTAEGFTTSKAAVVSDAASNQESHRRSLFHHNKNKNREKRTSSTGSSLFSSGTTIGPTSQSVVSNEKNDKGKMRSKLGSIFRTRKGKKGGELNHPNTINESDSISIGTGTTTPSLRGEQRARTQSVSSNNRLSMPASAQMPSFARQSVSTPSIGASAGAIVGAVAGATASAASFQPPAVPAKDNIASAPSYEDSAAPVVKQNLYEPMAPTKRSDSLSSANTPSASTPVSTSPVTGTVPSTASIPQVNGITDIPENVTMPGMQQTNTPPPPLPTSRKHVSSEPVAVQRQQPHGSIPTPPQQRKSVKEPQLQGNTGAPQQLQPAPTGSNQPANTVQTLAHNTTGGGGLVQGQIIHPSLTTPGLNASIVELFNASYKDGQLTRSNAIGEVAFSFINEENEIPQEIELQINSQNTLPNFMVNPMFLEQGSISSNNALFKINDPSQLLMRTVGGLKYMLNNPVAPIVITPIWKHEEKQSTVIISIKPVSTEAMDEYLKVNGGSIKLTSVLISASIQGAIVSTAATKPSGTLNKDKGRVTWLAKEAITFDANHLEERYVARFITNQQAKESEGGVQVKFNIANDDGANKLGFLNVDLDILAKGKNVVEDPFGDGEANATSSEEEWMNVPTLKSMVSGSYTGHS